MRMFIDDERNPKVETFDVVVRSYWEAICIFLAEGCPEYISFDHDLGEAESGYSIAHWIVEKDIEEYGNFIPDNFSWNVHSANPIGRTNINSLLKNYMEKR